MNALKAFAEREPLRLRAVIVAAVAVAACFGFQVDAETIIGLLVALGVLTESARRRVTPA